MKRLGDLASAGGGRTMWYLVAFIVVVFLVMYYLL